MGSSYGVESLKMAGCDSDLTILWFHIFKYETRSKFMLLMQCAWGISSHGLHYAQWADTVYKKNCEIFKRIHSIVERKLWSAVLHSTKEDECLLKQDFKEEKKNTLQQPEIFESSLLKSFATCDCIELPTKKIWHFNIIQSTYLWQVTSISLTETVSQKYIHWAIYKFK